MSTKVCCAGFKLTPRSLPMCDLSSYSTSGNRFCTRVPPSAGDSPSSKNMAACTDGESMPGTFHRRCGDTMMLSEGRRATSAPCDCPAFSPHQTAFSNAHILKGQVFSVKVSPEGEGHASPVIQKCTCNSFKRLAVCSVCPSWIAHTREQSEHKSS